MEANQRVARALAQVRAAIEALAHERGVEPPPIETFAQLLRFLRRLEVEPSHFFLAVFAECDDDRDVH